MKDNDKLKTLLKSKRISYRQIASALNISGATVNDIINDKYDGSKETKELVLGYINFILIDKVDVNEIIYKNIDLFIRVFSFAMRSLKNFTDDEAQILIDFILKLKKHKRNIEQNEQEK